MKKNPTPKIGRRGKTGYQDKPFKPSKKLLKSLGLTQAQYERRHQQRLERAIKRVQEEKFRTAHERTQQYKEQVYEAARTFAPEVVFGQPRNWLEEFQEKLQRFGDLVASGEYQGTFLGVGDLAEGQLIDKLAVLSNTHTIDTTADVLDTDVDLLLKALQGGILNRLEKAELNEQYYHLVRDTELQNEYDVDIDNVEKNAAVLRSALTSIDDVDSIIIFRSAVADGEVSLEKLEQGVSLFGNLTRGQLSKILDAWVENQTGALTTSRAFDLDEMFDAYLEGDGGNFWDIEDSEFWAWFRELFY